LGNVSRRLSDIERELHSVLTSIHIEDRGIIFVFAPIPKARLLPDTFLPVQPFGNLKRRSESSQAEETIHTISKSYVSLGISQLTSGVNLLQTLLGIVGQDTESVVISNVWIIRILAPRSLKQRRCRSTTSSLQKLDRRYSKLAD
jgi:hypothetical protein